MDPKRAQELLRDWQLQEPHHYVLCWVSCLVGLGAQRIRISASGARLVLRADQLFLPEEVVANPLGSLFAGQVSPPLRELAIGLNSALRYKGCRVTLKSCSGSEELEGRYRAGEFALHRAAAEGDVATEIWLERPFKGKDSFAPELSAIKEEFPHCPVELWLRDRQISQAVQVPAQGFCIHLKPDHEIPANLLRAATPAYAATLEHPAPIQAVVVSSPGPSQCHWLVMGRSYRMDFPSQLGEGDLGLHLWVACESLDKDLSLAHLVENERYQRVVQYLEDCLAAAVEEICERLTRLQLEDQEVELFGPLFAYAVEASARKGDFTLAGRLQKSLLRYPDRAGVERYRWDLLLESQLQGNEVLTGPDDAWSLQEFWAATRASLAIRGVSHRGTLMILQACSERAFGEGNYEITVRCLEPYLRVATDHNGQLSNRLGISLARLGHFSRAAEVLGAALERVGNAKSAPTWVYSTMEELSIVEARLGRYREAAQRLAEVLRYRKVSEGSRSRSLGVLLQRLVVLCKQLKDEKTARYYQIWAESLDR